MRTWRFLDIRDHLCLVSCACAAASALLLLVPNAGNAQTGLPDLQITGEPYAVYWNGPFTLWFLKQFEVHLPVRQVPPETSPATG